MATNLYYDYTTATTQRYRITLSSTVSNANWEGKWPQCPHCRAYQYVGQMYHACQLPLAFVSHRKRRHL